MATQEITKVQELIYTTKVEAVMATNVVVIEPSMSMAEVKELMRKKRISGAPVVEENEVVGIVSMSDVLRVMEQGRLHEPVTSNMNSPVQTVRRDASVIKALNNLGREGHARLPVVDHQGKLVGIVTTGTIVNGLLRELVASFQTKKGTSNQTYRASHFFQDMPSDDTCLILHFVIDDKDFDNAGKASSTIKNTLQRLGVPAPIVRRISVAVYEAEMNLVIHTDVGGEIIVDARRHWLKIAAVDYGPGIENLQQVLQPGYSTAPQWARDMGFGAGMGLANIKRCSDTMTLVSDPGGGTCLEIGFSLSETQKEPGKKA